MAPKSGANKRKHSGDGAPSTAKRPATAGIDDDFVDDLPSDDTEEAFPTRPAFDPKVYKLLLECVDLVKRTRNELSKHTNASKDLENMLSKAYALQKLPVPKRLMVALVGATGDGKSSLINRMTDEPGLAKEVVYFHEIVDEYHTDKQKLSAGESCTSVPTLYSHKLQWQTQKYAAKIRYLPISKCRTLLEELIRQYNVFNFEFEETWDNNMRNRYAQQANTAMQTFRTLFCNQPSFESQGAAERQLAWSYQSNRQSDLLDMMTESCDKALGAHDQEDDAGYTNFEFEYLRDLRSALDPLTSPNHSYEDPSLWPLVDHVHVGVSTTRVLRYITVVDLPGITDTNKLRVEATHGWIRKCQALWYVAAVDRICTDENLESTISDYAERFHNKLAIIATKIDTGVTDELAEDMETKGQSVGDYWEIKDLVASLQVELDKNRRMRRTADPSTKLRLYTEGDDLADKIDREDLRACAFLIDARNNYITQRLKDEKRQYMPQGAELRIVCVSNHHYSKFKSSESQGQRLGDINDTGIPELRLYALSLASPGVWETYEEHLSFKIKVFFSGVHSWAQGYSIKRHSGLIATVQKTNDLWPGLIDNGLSDVNKAFGSGIIQAMRNAHSDSQNGMMEWYYTITREPWWHNSFLAFFRNGGQHRTCAIGNESWNERFIERQTKNVITWDWDVKIPSPQEFCDAPVKKLVAAIEDLPDQLNRLPGSITLPIGAFDGVLSAYIVGIEAAHRRCKADYHQSLANVKLDVTLDQCTGHFAQSMQPCYDVGKQDRGKGVCKRLASNLLKHLTTNDPLGQATEKLSKALEATAEKHAFSLRDEVDRMLCEITRQFEVVWKRGTESLQEKKARQEISEFLAGVMPSANRIEGKLARIKQRYPGL